VRGPPVDQCGDERLDLGHQGLHSAHQHPFRPRHRPECELASTTRRTRFRPGWRYRTPRDQRRDDRGCGAATCGSRMLARSRRALRIARTGRRQGEQRPRLPRDRVAPGEQARRDGPSSRRASAARRPGRRCGGLRGGGVAPGTRPQHTCAPRASRGPRPCRSLRSKRRTCCCARLGRTPTPSASSARIPTWPTPSSASTRSKQPRRRSRQCSPPSATTSHGRMTYAT
jgi:hypothetical protein